MERKSTIFEALLLGQADGLGLIGKLDGFTLGKCTLGSLCQWRTGESSWEAGPNSCYLGGFIFLALPTRFALSVWV